MATKLELNHLDHKIYSPIKQIRGQKKNVQMLIAYIRKSLKLLTLRQLAKSS